MIIELILILSLSIMLRMLFMISNSSDDFVHIWNISERSKLSSLVKQDVSNSLISGKRGYPILNHYIISLFPRKYWVYVGKLINIVYDLIVILLFYFLIHVFFDFKYKFEFSTAFWATLLISTSSILFPVTARLKAMGARTFGFLLVFLYSIVVCYYFVYDNSYFLIIPMIILGIVILMSSQFAFQFFMFYNIMMSILFLDIALIISFAGVFMIAYLFPKLGLQDIINFKYNHNKWYLKNQQGTTAENRNSILDIFKLPLYLKNNIEHFINIIFYKNSYIFALMNLPLFFFLLYIYISSNHIVEPMELFLGNSLISLFIIFILTSHKPFIIFGQAERYLEYAAPFVCFYLLYLIKEGLLPFKLIIIFLLINLVIICINLFVINGKTIIANFKIEHSPTYMEMVKFLRKQKELKIMTIPIKLSFRLSIDLPQFKYYYRFINQEKTGFDYFVKDTQNLNIPNYDWNYFSEKYGINIIVVENKFKVKEFDDDNSLKLVYSSDDFVVYEICID